MEPLQQLSESLAAAAERAAGRSVRVEGRRRLASTGILWGDGALVVTAHHTIERGADVRVGLPGGGEAAADLVGRDPTTDVALLRLASQAGSVPKPKDAPPIEVGHLVLAVGRPGQKHQASLGIISALDDAWRTPFGGAIDRFLQTDVVMYPGFSGGPLVDAWGNVIGMNTSGLVRGLSLAVPVETLQRVADVLAKHGRIRRGYLGVGVQPARLPASAEQAAGTDRGLLVSSVEPGSPADAGGVLLGDVLLTLTGASVRSMEDLLAALSGEVVGQKAPLQVLRGGAITSLEITIGERQAPDEEDE